MNMDVSMPSRNISVSEDVYYLLQNMKLPGESFSQVIRRLVKSRSLREVAGLFSELDETKRKSIREGIIVARKGSSAYTGGIEDESG